MIWLAKGENIGTQCELRADGSSDIADLPKFATDNNLKAGSTCLVIDSSEVYMLNSSGEWKPL